MTDPLFRHDAYARTADARVTGQTPDGGVILDRTVFYPTGGGQTGDRGSLTWEGGSVEIVTAVKHGDEIALIPAEGGTAPPPGAPVEQALDWDHRHRCMRIHTCLHLLSVVIPLPVTGGQITAEKGRLDFDMPEAPEDKEALQAELNALITADHPVSETWITDAELEANPGLVKTMSVMPPLGSGRVRLVRIGTEDAQIDLQPCGGTHVKSTAEIGSVRLGKIEKKGRQNRRVSVFLED